LIKNQEKFTTSNRSFQSCYVRTIGIVAHNNTGNSTDCSEHQSKPKWPSNEVTWQLPARLNVDQYAKSTLFGSYCQTNHRELIAK